MEIQTNREGSTLTLNVSGRLDTTTAPQLEETLKGDIHDVQSLIFDFSNLEYVSSAGLRVLLATQKVMMKQGTMVIRHPNDNIMDVFEVTGMSDFLTIEK